MFSALNTYKTNYSALSEVFSVYPPEYSTLRNNYLSFVLTHLLFGFIHLAFIVVHILILLWWLLRVSEMQAHQRKQLQVIKNYLTQTLSYKEREVGIKKTLSLNL